MAAEIAQLVEQRPEKPCVPSSILGLGTFSLSGNFRGHVFTPEVGVDPKGWGGNRVPVPRPGK